MHEERVRSWLAAMARRVEAGEISAKTVNNARTCLSVALNEACRRGLSARNPCAGVPALPVDRQELDYLRLHEIEPYLDACMADYRPLARFLVGTGARVSEVIDIQFQHLALDEGVVRIYRQRCRDGADSRPTKGKRFRSVQIGPALVEALAELQLSLLVASVSIAEPKTLASDGWKRPRRGHADFRSARAMRKRATNQSGRSDVGA
jgi:integrase